jgi:hypothetical protein
MNYNANSDLSLSMQIPAEEMYLPNALATVTSICEHFELAADATTKIVDTINEALKESFVLSTANPDSLLNVNLSISNPLLRVELESQATKHSTEEVNSITKELFEASTNRIKSITDNFTCSIQDKSDSIFIMCFNLSLN